MPSRTDANQPAIVEALRAAGCSVFVESAHRGHPWDLVVRHYNSLYLLEVKSPGERLTPREEHIALLFPVAVVRSVDEALRAVEVLYER